ncbi:MAG: dihydrofolate reductase [Clostridia bacterium]|jgi:dihydrofolate reductase|nr:dihydrofolate reductase [Clostridia bacterium]MBT7122493.1 dihydrofolate reductase [Clostridia bacterium]
MRNIILYIATSLDGYLAREDGALDWLPQPTEDDMGYADFYDTIDTVVIGRTTYEQITQELSPDVWAYEGKTSYVATSKTLTPDPNVSFINGDIATFISNLKNAPGKDIWLVGGGKLIDAFVRANLIDKYIITIIPTILGDGIPLFLGNHSSIALKFLGTKTFGDIVQLTYSNKL